MPIITRKLLRKRSEHNEGMISTMEELTLHQEELEGINEVLGTSCRKLKILYLQNNLIWKMENLQHLKDLEYLNLALNNISKIEGLQNCEFLHKLDLTINFIDVDELEASIDHLQSRERLRDMYMMGNPCQSNWPGFTSYVIARLPQLQTLDGTEISRSMQITARQKLTQLQQELQQLATVVREEKNEKARRAAETAALQTAEPKSCLPSSRKDCPRVQELDENDNVISEDVDDEEDEDEAAHRAKEEDLTENTPEARQEIYRELAQQKKEKQDREDAMKPRERNYETEQAVALEEIRRKEEESGEKEVRQKNEGGWDFRWDEDTQPGCLVLDVAVARHLDSSLIDVDVHPLYVSMVIKSKVLRLRNPAEVRAGESKCQRSKTTGSLMVIMPKVNAKETTMIPAATRGTARQQANKSKQSTSNANGVPLPRKLTLQEQMMQLAMAEREKLDLGQPTQTLRSSAVDIKGIVPQPTPVDDESIPGCAIPCEPVFGGSHSKSLVTEID